MKIKYKDKETETELDDNDYCSKGFMEKHCKHYQFGSAWCLFLQIDTVGKRPQLCKDSEVKNENK